MNTNGNGWTPCIRTSKSLSPKSGHKKSCRSSTLRQSLAGCSVRTCKSQSGREAVFSSLRMGDSTTLAVHRCRFVDFTPSAITALAFPPLPLPSVKGKSVDVSNQLLRFGTLAVGRANGNIELCEWTGEHHQPQAAQAWVVRKVCWVSCLFVNIGSLILFSFNRPCPVLFHQKWIP